VATGHQVDQQIQVLKLVHLPSLGITDKTGGGITVHMIVYEQQRNQMMKKMQLLFLVRMDCVQHSACLILIGVVFLSLQHLVYGPGQ
jgi:hypothetical protein